MRDAFDDEGKPLPDHLRLTKVGQYVRSASLDELLQLINVLKGNMSLVGPRPLLIQYLSRYCQEQSRRHNVRPGITGWAQVNGRNAISWEEKFRLDVDYVDKQSFWLDCKILWMTFLNVIQRKGISADGHATMEEFKGNSCFNLDDILIKGKFRRLNNLGNFPIIFLFDEKHGNESNNIENNITNADLLINNCLIVLIGVESLGGGKKWCGETGSYVEEDNTPFYVEYKKKWKSNCTRFSDEVSKKNADKICGVECIEMMDKIEVDLYDKCQFGSKDAVSNHYLHQERSKHFLITLVDTYKEKKLKGNMILNCGLEHNNDIERWIRNDELKDIIDFKANFIRINTFDD